MDEIEALLPTVFLSHGSPTTPLEDIPARRFWAELGARYRGVKAVLCISAHWETRVPTVGAAVTPGTIHDFYGFPAELYRIRYPAPGAPKLASRVSALLNGAGIPCEADPERGLDHGAWVPLLMMFPKADVPVVQLSIQNHLDPGRHLALGRAIEPLRHEGIMIMGSGGAVHPLGYADWDPYSGKTDRWAMDFDKWLTRTVTSGNNQGLVRYREVAPYPERAHPRPDHYLPLVSAFGAAGPGASGRMIHHSWYMGDLCMAAYEFDGTDENTDKKGVIT